MSASKKFSRPIRIQELLNPTFSVPLSGARQRMSAYELGLRKDAKRALETNDPKAVYDLIKLFMDHEVLEANSTDEIPPIVHYPWYWDFNAYKADCDKAKADGRPLPSDCKMKFIEPLTEAGRKDIEERERRGTKPIATRPKSEGVGYRKPPQDKQFKKGVSGNPRGRARSAQDRRTVVHRVASSEVTITENGAPYKLRISEALLVMLRTRFLQGTGSKYYHKVVKNLLPEESNRKRIPLVLFDRPPAEEFAAQLARLKSEMEMSDAIEREEDEKLRLQLEKEEEKNGGV